MMKQELINLPTWAKVARVLGVIMGGLSLAAIVFIIPVFLSDLTYFWNQMPVTELIRDIYFVLLAIPIRFIKKRNFFEITYYTFAVIAIFRYGRLLWGILQNPEASSSIVIGVFILSAIFVAIIVSNSILVLKWEKFKVDQEPTTTPQST